MKKETAAQTHTRKHKAKRAARIAARPTPRFEPSMNIGSASAMSGPILMTDSNGYLWRVDGPSGTASRVSFN